jgi:hypothetical protein
MRTQGVADRAQFLDAPGTCGTDPVGMLVDGLGHEPLPLEVEPAEHVFAEYRQPGRALNDPYVRDPCQYPGEASATDQIRNLNLPNPVWSGADVNDTRDSALRFRRRRRRSAHRQRHVAQIDMARSRLVADQIDSPASQSAALRRARARFDFDLSNTR